VGHNQRRFRGNHARWLLGHPALDPLTCDLTYRAAPYTIVRPSWLTDRPATGVRLEQGDTGDGRISRDSVAAAVVAALFSPASRGKSFELYDDPSGSSIDWETAFAGLADDEGPG
jgi:hypothetical protein